MADTFTTPTWVKAEPHASAEFQVGDVDPGGGTDVINRVPKAFWANFQKIVKTLWDGVTLDGTSAADVTAFIASAALYTAALARQVTAVVVSNTVVETNLFSVSVAGATLGTTRLLRFTASGELLNNSGGTQNFRWRVYYGATVIADSANMALGFSASPGAWRIAVELSAQGATNAQVSDAELFVVAPGNTVTGSLFAPAANTPAFGVHDSVAIDSTAAQTFKLTITMGTAAATITCTLAKGHLLLI